MKRLLLIPAAGRGTRLGDPAPKVIAPVAGRPMLRHLVDLHAPHVEAVALVLHPSFEPLVRPVLDGLPRPTEVFFQQEPAGMLPAILLAEPCVRRLRPDWIWITWCDQIGIRPETLERLARIPEEEPDAAMVLPTCRGPEPYIHFERDPEGRILRVLHRREGDPMPEQGESDAGLFALPRQVYLEELRRFDARAETGKETAERNFLPFLPWLASRRRIVTFPVLDAMEAVGVNTPDERKRMEEYLADRF